jgi:hypothetical protein
VRRRVLSWTFEREAKWLLVLYGVPLLLGMLFGIVLPMIMR